MSQLKIAARVKILFLLLCSSLSLNAASVTITAVPQQIATGSGAQVSVSIADVTDLYAFGFDFAFDPAVLNAVSVSEGDEFGAAGTFFLPGDIDNLAGVVAGIAGSIAGPGPGVDTPGILITAQFLGVGSGGSQLSLLNFILIDSGGNDIPFSVGEGSISVSAPTPEPASWQAALCGLLLVALFASRHGASLKKLHL